MERRSAIMPLHVTFWSAFWLHCGKWVCGRGGSSQWIVSLGGRFQWYLVVKPHSRVHYCKRGESILHSTAATKQRMAKWPFIANAFFGFVQNHSE